MFKRLRIIFVVVAAAFAWACDNGGSTETHYIKLSDSSLTFNGAGNGSRTVTVASSPADWKAEPAVSWIKITETGKNSFVLTVDDSNVAEEREGIITVTAGQATVEVKVSQLPMDTEFARFRTMYEYENGMVMSPSGKYAGGFYATLDEDGSLLYHAVVTEVETDRKYEFGPYPMSLFEFGYPNAITDQGTIVFSTKTAGNYVINLDGTYYELATPTGMSAHPSVASTSADGNVWVGYAMKSMNDGHGSLYWPLKWVDGEAQELKMPATSYRGEEYTSAQFLNGVMARGISANGEIIYGSTWDNFDFGMVYWDRSGEPHFVGEDVRKVKPVQRSDGMGDYYDYNLVDGIICYASASQVSPNGKWLAGTYRKEELADDEMSIEETYYAAFFNTETGTTYIIDEYGPTTACGVTDDGEGFVGIGSSMCTSSIVVDVETGIKLGTAQEWVYDTFGIYVPDCRLELCCAGKEVITGATPLSDAILGLVDGYFYVAPPAGK